MSPQKYPLHIVIVIEIILFCNSTLFLNYHIECITKIKIETLATFVKKVTMKLSNLI